MDVWIYQNTKQFWATRVGMTRYGYLDHLANLLALACMKHKIAFKLSSIILIHVVQTQFKHCNLLWNTTLNTATKFKAHSNKDEYKLMKVDESCYLVTLTSIWPPTPIHSSLFDKIINYSWNALADNLWEWHYQLTHLVNTCFGNLLFIGCILSIISQQ